MENEMVRRVSAAFAETLSATENWEKAARAGIAAMRERPPEGVANLIAGIPANAGFMDDAAYKRAAQKWGALIDEALKG